MSSGAFCKLFEKSNNGAVLPTPDQGITEKTEVRILATLPVISRNAINHFLFQDCQQTIFYFCFIHIISWKMKRLGFTKSFSSK
jgi:hypothetical protein